MKCHDVQTRLIDLLYGELAAGEATAAGEHLAECETCRRDFEALKSTRQVLSAVPQSRVEVDVHRIHARAMTRALQARQRWKWMAVVAAAMAGVVLLLGARGMRVEVHQDHLLLSWGREQNEEEPPKQPASSRESEASIQLSEQLTEHEARLAHLDELMRLVVLELDGSGRRQRTLLSELADRVDGLQAISNARWNSTEHDVQTLYQWAQYTSSQTNEGEE